VSAVDGCPDCGYENRQDARFCGGCGGRLLSRHGTAVSQASSGTEVKRGRGPAPEPPKHLADKILHARKLEGERKQVTVLFADVKGSMDLAAQLDPEEWHRIMDRFFATLADGVYRFEGTINQYGGDGIMALFGAPIAHEDHAQRACYAALHLGDALRRYAQELRRERGLDFSVRMGINSGEVVVGTIGDDLRMDYTAQGHTVGLAARMEQLAEAGRVYLTEHTAAIVSGFFRLEDLGLFTIKGVAAPTRVFALLGPGPLQSRFEVARARGLSRFVGRSEEMAQLERTLERVLGGSGQVVGVVGEAGVGKSRLCFELLQRARSRGASIYAAHCVSHGKTVAFLPLLGLLRGYFGINEQDSDGEAQRKIAGTVLLQDASLTESLPLIFDFLGVGEGRPPLPQLDPVARQHRLFELLRLLIRGRSASEPTILLFEDLHWIDAGSEAFLDTLAQDLSGTRLFLLVNFRPQYDPRWLERAGAEQLPLVPLPAAAIDELLCDLLGADSSLTVLADRIRERTGGNPFFIEEVVRSMVDHGALVSAPGGARAAGRPRYILAQPVTDIQIPPTVQAVLAARIDRLGERERGVLYTAAVIGKRFWEPVLRRVLGMSESDLTEALLVLAAAEFIYGDVVYPEVEYAFQHPLTREVAYQTQLGERRSRVHAAVARAIAELYADRLDERAAVLAHHWEGAGDALEAARWNRRAAEWIRLSNLPQALRHWQQVHRLLRSVETPPERDALALEACIRLLEIGWRLGIADEEAAALVSEGEHLAHGTGDVAGLARLVSAYGSVKSHRGNADAWVEHCRRAVQLADQTDNAGLQLATRSRLTLSLGFAGRLVDALELAEGTLAGPPADVNLGLEILGYSPYIRLMEHRAHCLIDMGRLDEGAERLVAVTRLAHEHGEIEILGWVHGQHVSLARIRGDADTAVTHAREGMRIADKLGSPFFRAGASLSFGQAHILSGQWREALAALEDALAIARVGRAAVDTEPLALAWMAAAYLGLRDAARAREAAEEALSVAQQRATRVAECIAHIGRARVMIRTDGVRARAAIEGELERAMELVEKTGAASNDPFIRVQRARLAALSGDAMTWQGELRRARDAFMAMGATARAVRLPVTGL
jgi:class 3 adenylate cyclase/tetratricopeptide (TPR) repeat protein